jgi:type IV secretory pathway component VirB8
VYIALAWIIGIILIMRLQTIVRNFIREDKEKMIKEIVKRIKDLEEKKLTRNQMTEK